MQADWLAVLHSIPESVKREFRHIRLGLTCALLPHATPALGWLGSSTGRESLLDVISKCTGLACRSLPASLWACQGV